jgi:hypothetical protein
MVRVLTRAFIIVAAAACAVSGARTATTRAPLGAYPPRDLTSRRPLTRAEASGFLETSSYQDVMVFIEALRVKSNAIYVTSLGKSPQGKDLPLMIVSRPMVKTPAEARRLGRPIVYVQANIHGGEVEGKEALLALLRDLELDKYKNVVDSLVILAVPIYNADGNDSLGPQVRNRGAQNGPALIGQRANGQGFDLNRDYIKAEAPETRASLQVFREWEPDVLVDLHTTNGSYHGYALTWAPPLNPAAKFSGPFTRDTVLPTLADALRSNRGLLTFPYGNFEGADTTRREWRSYDHRPRFGTNYYGLRGRISILSEAYSHDPFKTRIASTYAFVHDLLSLIAANAEDVLEVGREADRHTTAYGTTPSASQRIAIRSRLTTKPAMGDVLVEDLIRTGDTVRTEAGLRPGFRRSPKARAVKMPIVDRFEATLDQTLPYAWVIPAAQKPLLEHLQRHGVFVEELAERVSLRAERFTVDSIIRAGQPFQGHQETRLNGRWSAVDSVTLDAGTYIVRGGQPLGILALYLLEPQSDDGLVNWNFLDPWLQQGGAYPLLRVTERISAPLRPVRD